MGVLVRRPGDKVRIDPAKFWGSVSMLALFAALAFQLYGGKAADAETAIGAVEDRYEGSSAGVSPPKKQPNDPNCPRVMPGAPDDGLIALCGRIYSARIDNYEDSSGDVLFRNTQGPIVGVTVALYESDPRSPTGKSSDGALTNLFSSTYTNSHGRYRLKMRGLGPGNLNVYVVVLCDGKYAGGKRINSLTQINNLDIGVNCDPFAEYGYEIPPKELEIEDRDSIVECTTDVLDKAGTSSPPFNISLNYEKPSNIRVESEISETNYDFRYVSTGRAQASLGGSFFLGTNNLFEESPGALWVKDCEIRNPGDEWLCRSSTMNQVYSSRYGTGPQGYLLNTALRFIPEAPELLAWRRLDNRDSFKQMNQYPFSVTQYMSAYFGDYVGNSPLILDPSNSPGFLERLGNDLGLLDTIDPLKVCEDIEEGNKAVVPFDRDAERLSFSRLTRSLGIGLASPGTWDDIIAAGRGAPELDDDYCKSEETGIVYTVREILENPVLRRRFFSAAMLFEAGIGFKPWNTELTNDSTSLPDNVVRSELYSVFFSEGVRGEQAKDQAHVVFPESKNRQGSVVRALAVSGTFGGPPLLNSMASPYGEEADSQEDEEEGDGLPKIVLSSGADRPATVWDIGDNVTGHCAVSSIYDDFDSISREIISSLGSNLHNLFFGNPGNITDDVVGSGTFYTPDSLVRDLRLSDRNSSNAGQEFFGWGVGEGRRDVFDSFLEMASGGAMSDEGVIETKVDLSTLNILESWALILQNVFFRGLGPEPTKSYGDRDVFQEVVTVPRMVSFPLNAQNFTSAFPAYPQAGYPGGSGIYPWTPLTHGKTCDVWPGPGNDPNNELRTCKLTRCRYYQKESVKESITTCKLESDCENGIQGEYCGYMVERMYECTENEWDIERDDRACTSEERRTCLVSQRDDRNCGYNCVPTPPRGRTTSHITCALSVAGPYTYIAPFETKIEGVMEQDEERPNQVGTALDPLVESAYKINRGFASPYGDNVVDMKLATADWRHSKNPGKLDDGYDTPGLGVGTERLNAISASPTSPSYLPAYKNITYHCDMTFVDMEGNVRPMPPGIVIVSPDGSDPWDCQVKPFVIGECDPELFNSIPGGIPEPIFEAEEYFTSYIIEKLIPEVVEAYGFASVNTGVPCEILAGIHHMEGANNSYQSLLNGSPINIEDLAFNALTAATILKGKLQKPIETWTFEDYAEGLDYYNGPGNENCTDPITQWGSDNCPSSLPFYGWDHPYPMSWMDDTHTNMQIKYCYDYTLCTDLPGGEFLLMLRPGAIPVAKMFNQFTTGQ